jgi:hypothetical protein
VIIPNELPDLEVEEPGWGSAIPIVFLSLKSLNFTRLDLSTACSILFSLRMQCRLSDVDIPPHARITEVLDPKGLRKGMNRQDTNREDQKADDQLANFLFLHQAYKQYKAGSYTMQGERPCLGNNALYLRNSVFALASLVS